MESWHCTKTNKYLALKSIVEFSGWCAELCAGEVGARGYFSKSVLCCFKKLGFNNDDDTASNFFNVSIWLRHRSLTSGFVGSLHLPPDLDIRLL